MLFQPPLDNEGSLLGLRCFYLPGTWPSLINTSSFPLLSATTSLVLYTTNCHINTPAHQTVCLCISKDTTSYCHQGRCQLSWGTGSANAPSLHRRNMGSRSGGSAAIEVGPSVAVSQLGRPDGPTAVTVPTGGPTRVARLA